MSNINQFPTLNIAIEGSIEAFIPQHELLFLSQVIYGPASHMVKPLILEIADLKSIF